MVFLCSSFLYIFFIPLHFPSLIADASFTPTPSITQLLVVNRIFQLYYHGNALLFTFVRNMQQYFNNLGDLQFPMTCPAGDLLEIHSLRTWFLLISAVGVRTKLSLHLNERMNAVQMTFCLNSCTPSVHLSVASKS